MKFLILNRKYFKWLFRQAITFKKNIFLCLLLNIFAVTLSLFFVELTKNFLQSVEQGDEISLPFLLFVLAALKILHISCEELKLFLRNKTNDSLKNALSLKFFKALLASRIPYEKFHSADALSRLTADVADVSICLTETIPALIYALIQLIATAVYLAFIEPSLTLAIIAIMPAAILLAQFYAKKLLPVFKELRIRESKVAQFIQEHIQHHELIVALEKSSFIWRRLESLQRNLFEFSLRRTKLSVLANSVTDFAFGIGYVLIFSWGIYGIQNHTFSCAELVVFLQLAENVQLPFIQFQFHYPNLVKTKASAVRLFELENFPKENSTSTIKFSFPLGIKFSNVNFRYKDSRWIYRKFNYDFAPCTATAIVGETGAGKSTLLRLILGFIFPNSGTISFYGNGKNCNASSQTRVNCVYVPQGNSLISGTIRYNMMLGKSDATEEEMRLALYYAAADFVFDFPSGLDTFVGEGGIGVSEGQAQRIAIARSFLRPGNVLLLDEPTSALDAETEKMFLTRLTNQAHDKTIIIVTHKKEVSDLMGNILRI